MRAGWRDPLADGPGDGHKVIEERYNADGLCAASRALHALQVLDSLHVHALHSAPTAGKSDVSNNYRWVDRQPDGTLRMVAQSNFTKSPGDRPVRYTRTYTLVS